MIISREVNPSGDIQSRVNSNSYLRKQRLTRHKIDLSSISDQYLFRYVADEVAQALILWGFTHYSSCPLYLPCPSVIMSQQVL
jgi:hypothetical protein